MAKEKTRTLVILVVGLTRKLIGEHTPNLQALVNRGSVVNLEEVTPAVTCSAQATFMTGLTPEEHGIVANGWLFRETDEVALWKQSRSLIQGETIWERAKKNDPEFTSARMFWWYNMYDRDNDWAATPRPQYPSDGRKLPDIWTEPGALRDELQDSLGQFPLFHFWGPTSSIRSSRWIADSTLHVFKKYKPTLTLAYLPHLDYPLQKMGPDHPDLAGDLRQIDGICGEMIREAETSGAKVIVLSEYGITPVDDAIHINRALRKAGYIRVRNEEAGEVMDPAGSRAFAVCDHQIAHIYIPDPSDIPEVRKLILSLDGVERVLEGDGKREIHIDHSRSGELVAISRSDRWFSYYYWLDESKKPDFASTVDIHKKPGYDPVELFLNPEIRLAKLKILWILLKRKLGFRTLLNVIGTRTRMVRGSHGRPVDDPDQGPLLISSQPGLFQDGERIHSTRVKSVVLDHIFGAGGWQ